MGRKRKSPQIVLLRVFDSDTKLTEEQISWLTNRKENQDDTSIRREKKVLCDYSKRNS